jgi:hypothetical protein
MPFWGGGLQPATPQGFAFDYVNADVVRTRMSVDTSGKIILPDGMSYSILVLPVANEMTLPVLKKIKDMVWNGVVIAGPKPLMTPGLTGYPNSDQELKDITAELWGDLDGVSRTKRGYGKGFVTWGLPLEKVMPLAKLAPDVEYSKPLDADLSWIHRKDKDADIYFLVNRSDKPQDMNIRFRISGKEPELWHSDNGQTEKISYRIENGKTTITYHFEGNESVFVVFNKKAVDTSATIPGRSYQNFSAITGSWDISFPENSGAPAHVLLDSLSSWTNNADTGVKYFSGTAVYKKTFDIKKDISAASKIFIDLGVVGDIAEVILNGKVIDTLWKAPFRADISSAVKKGKNILEIKVTNEWTNRLMGDRLAPADKKVLSSYTNPFGGQYKLTPSGLIGPVKIVTQVVQKNK